MEYGGYDLSDLTYSSFMHWRLIDKFPQNVNGFRYVSENRGKFWICSYRQSGSMIIFSIVSAHVETVALLIRQNQDRAGKARI